MKQLCSCLLVLINMIAVAQNFSIIQQELIPLGNEMLKGKTLVDREEAANKFKSKFKKALELNNSFKFNFDSLENVSKAFSEDGKLKVYTWLMPLGDGTFRYYGFVQTNLDKNNYIQLFELTDPSNDQIKPDRGRLDQKKWNTIQYNYHNWIGCLYYKCITTKYKKKTHYTLLGWEGYNNLSTRKIIEPIIVNAKGDLKFGDTRFKDENRGHRRVIFEYAEQASMSLKYYPENQEIIFDHLSPPEPQLKGQFQFYGPDFSYDAYFFDKGKWIYKKEVTPRNEKDQEKTVPKIEKINDDKMYKPKK